MKRIAILFGGCSSEYPVSLQSAHAIINHVNRDKYEVVLIGITRQGEWFRYDGDYEEIAADTWHERLHHGTGLREGGNVFRTDRGDRQYFAGSGLYLFISYGSPRCGTRNDRVPGIVLPVGLHFPVRGIDTFKNKKKVYENGKWNRATGACARARDIYHAGKRERDLVLL